MYLTDEDLTSMLKHCGQNLQKDGIIIIKENVFDENDIGTYSLDTSDNSVIRTKEHFKMII